MMTIDHLIKIEWHHLVKEILLNSPLLDPTSLFKWPMRRPKNGK